MNKISPPIVKNKNVMTC